MNYSELLEIKPYALGAGDKRKLLTERLVGLTKHHRKNCRAYDRMLSAIGYDDAEVLHERGAIRLEVENRVKLLTSAPQLDEKVLNGILSVGSGFQYIIRHLVEPVAQ